MEVHFQYLFFEEGNGNPLQKIPWMEEPGRLQPMGLQRVGHDWAASLSLEIFYQKILAGPNGKKLWKHMIWAVWKWPDMSESKYLDTFG